MSLNLGKLERLNMATAYIAGCLIAILAFTVLTADYNHASVEEGGTVIILSATAELALLWVLTIAIGAVAIIAATLKSPMGSLGPLLMYILTDEILGGAHFLGGPIYSAVIAVVVLCTLIAAYRMHPILVIGKTPDDASSLQHTKTGPSGMVGATRVEQ